MWSPAHHASRVRPAATALRGRARRDTPQHPTIRYTRPITPIRGGVTRAAIDARYPQESGRRAAGWYHYRPPNGENFADVRDRLAAFLADAHEAYAGRRVLIVAHDSVVLMVRGVIENLDAAAIEAVERAAGGVRNASVTRFTAGPAGLQLVAYNTVDHLDVVTAVLDEG